MIIPRVEKIMLEAIAAPTPLKSKKKRYDRQRITNRPDDRNPHCEVPVTREKILSAKEVVDGIAIEQVWRSELRSEKNRNYN